MLFTIGYQGRELAEVIAVLGMHEVDRVIDVRELPLSRRRGFSKTPLAEALAVVGIDYVHLRAAGNPYRRDKDSIPRDELLAKYRTHLNASRPILSVVADAVRDRRAALLCFERAVTECHRGILAPRVARKLGVGLKNL